jgi:hypothetical protein
MPESDATDLLGFGFALWQRNTTLNKRLIRKKIW